MDRHYSSDHFPIYFVSNVLGCVLDHGNAVVLRTVGRLFFEFKRLYPGHVEECFRRMGMLGNMNGAQTVLAISYEDNFLMEWREWVNSNRN